MNGPYRFFVLMIAVFGAALPFATLWFFLPDESLVSAARMSMPRWILNLFAGEFDIPDKLVPEFAFIGVAVFISCLPDWLSDEHFHGFKRGRRNSLMLLRGLCFVSAGISFLYYIRIVLNLNEVLDKKFKFDLAANKLALFTWVVAVCLTSFVAVLLHLGPPQETRP